MYTQIYVKFYTFICIYDVYMHMYIYMYMHTHVIAIDIDIEEHVSIHTWSVA